MLPLLVLACGPVAAPATEAAVVPAAPSSAAPVVPPPVSNAPADVLARMTPDLQRCYASGKAATPSMEDGRVTLNGTLSAAGKITCAIPSEAMGLTQDVIDCMSDRLAAEVLGAGEARTLAVPIAVKSGTIGLGSVATTMLLESIETTRMPDAFDVLDAIEPGLQECVRGVGPKSLLLGVRIGADGKTQCALARPSEGLPASVVGCATNVFQQAKFPAPKRGSTQAVASGIVLVPITVGGGR